MRSQQRAEQSSHRPQRVPGRFLAWLAGAVLAGCAGWAAVVLGTTSWQASRRLDAIFPFYAWRIRSFTAAELQETWQALALLSACLGLGTVLLAISATGRTQQRAWRQEIAAAWAGLAAGVARLPRRQRRLSAIALGLLTGLRCWLSQPRVTPGYDDVPSYELFASKTLLAVSAYYPVPNNHVLSNTLNWLFYQLHPGFWFTMRLPVLLAATVATVLLFAGLLQFRVGFRPALLAVGLFGLAQSGLYHAAVGRGYWLLTLLAGVVFFSTLALRLETAKPRAAWTGLVLGSVLGAFTVPSFGYVLVSAYSWLGVGYLRQRDWRGIGQLAGIAGTVGAATLLLYAPLLFVSGPGSLFQNGFVAPMPPARFWSGLPGYWWQTEGFLAGQLRVGGVLAVAGVAGVGLGLRAGRVGLGTPPPPGLAWQQLVPAACWFMLLPYAVMAAQRVFAPGRVLLYKAFFLFLLLALVFEWLRMASPQSRRRWLDGALGIALLCWFGYQFGSLLRESQPIARRNAALHAAFDWLARQPRGPMLIPEPTQSLFVRMYLHSERPAQTWFLDARPRPGMRYAYVLAFPDQRGQFQPVFSGPPAFHNEQVDIYRASALPPESYWRLAN